MKVVISSELVEWEVFTFSTRLQQQQEDLAHSRAMVAYHKQGQTSRLLSQMLQ